MIAGQKSALAWPAILDESDQDRSLTAGYKSKSEFRIADQLDFARFRRCFVIITTWILIGGGLIYMVDEIVLALLVGGNLNSTESADRIGTEKVSDIPPTQMAWKFRAQTMNPAEEASWTASSRDCCSTSAML